MTTFFYCVIAVACCCSEHIFTHIKREPNFLSKFSQSLQNKTIFYLVKPLQHYTVIHLYKLF